MIVLALEWLGSMLQIFGAVGLAARLCKPREAYWTMLPGAVIWLGIAAWSANWPLAAMQATFSIINSVGIARWGR